jgi:hypothetical protein
MPEGAVVQVERDAVTGSDPELGQGPGHGLGLAGDRVPGKAAPSPPLDAPDSPLRPGKVLEKGEQVGTLRGPVRFPPIVHGTGGR